MSPCGVNERFHDRRHRNTMSSRWDQKPCRSGMGGDCEAAERPTFFISFRSISVDQKVPSEHHRQNMSTILSSKYRAAAFRPKPRRAVPHLKEDRCRSTQMVIVAQQTHRTVAAPVQSDGWRFPADVVRQASSTCREIAQYHSCRSQMNVLLPISLNMPGISPSLQAGGDAVKSRNHAATAATRKAISNRSRSKRSEDGHVT